MAARIASKRRLATAFAAVVAWELLILSAYAFRPGSTTTSAGLGLAILGGIMVVVALRLVHANRAIVGVRRASPLPPTSFTYPNRRTSLLITITGIFPLWIIAESNGNALQAGLFAGMSYHLQAVLLFAGTVLVTWGMSGTNWRDLLGTRWAINPRWERWALVGILLVAFGLRFWQLDQQPRFLVDELNTIGYIRELRARGDIELLRPMTNVSPFPWTFAYGQFLSVDILGRNFMGLRGASAVTGTLTVAAVYLLAAILFDRKTGLLAALLLATFPPHVHFSRLALLNIADPLIGTLMLAFVARGMKRLSSDSGPKPTVYLDFTIAGTFLGLTQYFYEGGRLFYPVLLVMWLLVGCVRRERFRQSWRGLVIMAVTAVIISVPVYYTWQAIGARLTGRMEASGLNQDDVRLLLLSPLNSQVFQRQLDRLNQAFLFYIHQPDKVLFYGGQTALILTPLVPAFLMGIAYCLWQRRWLTLLLLWWIIATGFANNVLVISAASSRFMVVVPALVILIATGLRYGLPLVWAAPPGVGTRTIAPPTRRIVALCGVVFVAIVGALAGLQAVYYFDQHLPYYSTQFRYDHHYRDLDDVAFRSLNFPVNTRIYVVTTYEEQDTNYVTHLLGFMTDDLIADTVIHKEFTADYVTNLLRDVNHAFFIDPDNHAALALIRQQFKVEAPQYSPYSDMPLGKQYMLYFAPVSQGQP